MTVCNGWWRRRPPSSRLHKRPSFVRRRGVPTPPHPCLLIPHPPDPARPRPGPSPAPIHPTPAPIRPITDLSHTLAVADAFLLGLFEQRQRLEPFVASTLAQVLARLTKAAWQESDVFHGTAERARRLLQVRPGPRRARHGPMPADASLFAKQGDTESALAGVLVLTQLVQEMGHASFGRTSPRHRKALASFRDDHLLGILRDTLALLERLRAHPWQGPPNGAP